MVRSNLGLKNWIRQIKILDFHIFSFVILIQNKKDEDRENDKGHKRIDLYMPELALCYPGTDIYLESRVLPERHRHFDV